MLHMYIYFAYVAVYPRFCVAGICPESSDVSLSVRKYPFAFFCFPGALLEKKKTGRSKQSSVKETYRTQ